MTENMKMCKICNVLKEFSYFGFLKKSKDGYRSECKDCRNFKTRECYAKDPVKFKLRKEKWKQNNPEVYRLGNKNYYANNVEKIKLYGKNNRTQININHKNWTIKNREKENKRLYKLRKLRYKNDPSFRLRLNISSSLNFYLRMQNVIKSNKTWKHLLYTPQQLKEHLESLWEPWMNWDNYGKVSHNKMTWQIDHLIPQSKFDFSNEDEIRKCWALENLRPLDSFENIKKRDYV